jgi:hypothetical protein
MIMTTRLALALVLLVLLGQQAQAEAKLSYIDLRVEAGEVVGGPGASITLISGNLGDKKQQEVTIDQDMGIVLGLRGLVSRCQVSFDHAPASTDSFSLDLTGGEALGGIGLLINPNEHIELVAGYALGLTAAHSGFVERGRFRGWMGEAGYYRGFKSGMVLGLAGGWTFFQAQTDDASGAALDIKLSGLDLVVSMGYRF